jgi:hypothetical protein
VVIDGYGLSSAPFEGLDREFDRNGFQAAIAVHIIKPGECAALAEARRKPAQ